MSDFNRVAIVDFGMGNLFSVRQACETVGLAPTITVDPDVVDRADGVILPGVGAYADAMRVLRDRGLADALCRTARSGRPLVGICLGMQLMMNVSEEFGRHEGLGLIPGTVRRLPSDDGGRRVKVPQVGWNRVAAASGVSWEGTALRGLASGVYMYFTHSFFVEPADRAVALAETTYGGLTYCSALRFGNIHAVQFHPEKSGDEGLGIYRNIAGIIRQSAAMVSSCR